MKKYLALVLALVMLFALVACGNEAPAAPADPAAPAAPADPAKEGYTGAGWQKNVYGDAIACGIYDGTETKLAQKPWFFSTDDPSKFLVIEEEEEDDTGDEDVHRGQVSGAE